MTQSALTALALCFCGGAIWVRRKSWRIRWDRALTMSFLFQGLGFALCAPAMSRYLEPALFRITGVAHLRDFFGHVLFICAICGVIYACACRLVPDRELESVLYKIEIPASIAGGAMLAAITLSHNLSREPPPDFVNVPCDFWLRVTGSPTGPSSCTYCASSSDCCGCCGATRAPGSPQTCSSLPAD